VRSGSPSTTRAHDEARIADLESCRRRDAEPRHGRALERRTQTPSRCASASGGIRGGVRHPPEADSAQQRVGVVDRLELDQGALAARCAPSRGSSITVETRP